VARFASGPASGQVRQEHWQIFIFSFFWIKEKGQREKYDGRYQSLNQVFSSLLQTGIDL